MVDTPFQGQSLNRIDVGVTYDVLIMPLYGIYPTLQIKAVLYGIPFVWIADGSIHIIRQMIIPDGLQEDVISLFCKGHFSYVLCFSSGKFTQSFSFGQHFMCFSVV